MTCITRVKVAHSLHLRITATFLFIACLLHFPSQLEAQGDLLVFPKRVVFDNGKTFQTITLSNVGKDTATYSISFVQMRMTEDGRFERIDLPDPGQMFADTFIRFFPHSVTLAPNESQLVKLQLIKTNQLKPGEYRSHLYLRATPKAIPNNPNANESTSISALLTPIFGITMACIIRVGEAAGSVGISNMYFERQNDSIPILHLEFDRKGNISEYGDITVNYISQKGKVTKVGGVQGFAIYTPNTLRTCKLELKKIDGVDYSLGSLQVIYRGQPDSKSELLAESTLQLSVPSGATATKQH